MQSLIDPVLVYCFQFIPQFVDNTIYLKDNNGYPVHDEAIQNEKRLKELLALLTVNKRWNKVLKQYSKLCWNNCCYQILEKSYFVSVAKFLHIYPYLDHISIAGIWVRIQIVSKII